MMAGMQPGMQPGAAGMQPGPQAMQLPAAGMRPPQGMPQMPGQATPLQQMGGLPHGMAQSAMPGMALPPGRHSPGAAEPCPLTQRLRACVQLP